MKKSRKTILGQGCYLRLVKDGRWEYADRLGCCGVVVIIPVISKGKIVLIEQYRHAVKKRVIEFPAGLVGDKHKNESFISAARRELIEETGYRAGKMKKLLQGPISSGTTTENIVFLMATDLKKISSGGGVEAEDITVHVVSLSTIERWLRRQERLGKSIDPKIFTGLYFLIKKR